MLSDNKRYKDLKVSAGVYIPDVGINYPEDNPVERLLNAPKDREIVFDENYPYLDDSLSFRLQNWFGYVFVLYGALMPVNTIKYGIRFRGRDILRKYRRELKGGAITIANHCYRWDAPAVLQAVHAGYHTRIPMFADNFCTKDHWFLKHVGGIPVPDNMSALKKFNEAFDEFHHRGWWFHVFPEAANWRFYKPLRPFRKGAFSMSYKYDMPILPCVITYRKRTGIFRLFGKQDEPLLTVTIGEPIFPDRSVSRKTEVDRMRNEARLRMEQMACIEHNTWPVVPEDE